MTESLSLMDIDEFIVSYGKLFDFKEFKYDLLYEATEVETFFGRKKVENRYYMTRSCRDTIYEGVHHVFSYDRLFGSYKFVRPNHLPHDRISTVYWEDRQDSINFLTTLKGRLDPKEHVSYVVFSSDDVP